MLKKFLEYLQLEKKYSSLTIKSYERDLTDLILFLENKEEKKTKLEEVNKKQLRNFIIYLSQKNISEKTINRKISSIRSFYKFLLKVEKITLNPTSNLQNLKIKKQVLIPYTEEEIKLLDSQILNDENANEFEKVRNSLIIHFFYQTGIRRIELIQLETNKINLINNTISIIGKRNKERLIPITHNLKEKIAKYLEIKNKNINPNNNFFFTSENGEKLNEKFVYSLVNKYLTLVTSKEKKSPHMLRHTFASHLLHNGAEINSIKELLGHSNLAATQIYTHSNIEDLKKVFNLSHPFGTKKMKK